MRRPSDTRFWTENLVWLAGSLVLAIFVWIAATVEQNPVQVARFPQRIPIQIITDEGFIVTNTPITTAQVVLRTQAAVWEILEAADISIVADLTGQPPGTYNVELDISFSTARRIVVEDWQPRQITVTIDQAAEILVPVNADIRSDPPTGFELTGISFNVPEVRVIGPASQVSRIVRADARLHMRDERSLFTREIQLSAVDEEGRLIPGVTLEPASVTVTANIQAREGYREVFVTPNIVGEPAEGYVLFGVDYRPPNVLVSGPPALLDQLPGTVLTEAIDLAGQTETFSRTVNVELPAGINSEQAISVTVQIDTLTASRRFEHLPVTVQGLDPGLNASFSSEEVTLLITGPEPIVDTLTPDDITILADLTGLAAGGYQVQLRAFIDRTGLEEASTSVLPSVLDVQITGGTPGVTYVPPTSTPQP